LTLGFAFELGKNALKIESKQVHNFNYKSWNSYSLIYY
jgi:NADH-ubiquinone oxidoreductase chain 3